MGLISDNAWEWGPKGDHPDSFEFFGREFHLFKQTFVIADCCWSLVIFFQSFTSPGKGGPRRWQSWPLYRVYSMEDGREGLSLLLFYLSFVKHFVLHVHVWKVLYK